MKEFKNGVLEANVGVFIIPNSMGNVNDFLAGKEAWLGQIKRIIELNGLQDKLITGDVTKEPLVQLWFHSNDDLGSDNLARHGWNARINDTDFHCRYSSMEYLPACLFDGKREGDVIDIIFPCNLQDMYDHYRGDYKLIFHTKLNQLDFRYSHRGKFEECLHRLLCDYKEMHPTDIPAINPKEKVVPNAETCTEQDLIMMGIKNGPAGFTDRMWVRTTRKWNSVIYVYDTLYSTNDKMLWEIPDGSDLCRLIEVVHRGFRYLFYVNPDNVKVPVAYALESSFVGDKDEISNNNSIANAEKAWWN